MRRFLVTSALLFLGALIAIVVVFLVVLFSRESVRNEAIIIMEDVSGVDISPNIQTNEEVGNTTSTEMPTTGKTYALKDFALSDTERDLLAAAGINPETFIITETMVSCAIGKVGQARFDEIVGGSAPSFLEMTRVIPCLTQ